MTFQIIKFWKTLKLAALFIKVRTFGEYVVTEHGPNQPPLAIYWYKGNRFWIQSELMKGFDQ